MMSVRAWTAAMLLLIAAGELEAASPVVDICPKPSAVRLILEIPATCSALDLSELDGPIGIIEGDEATLLRAVNLVHKNRDDYVAVLFYASWCPFSKICKLNFRKLSTLFPRIKHFAFEESIIRPSIISRYGVHGFPTLFLFNSTMRIRYHGSRTISSLVAFYNDVTGVNPTTLDPMSLEETLDPSDLSDLNEETEQENCPFSWARSPEKLLQQDSYLALASAFLLLRFLYFLFPTIKSCIKWVWRRHLLFADDYFRAYVEQAKQGFSRLNPYKKTGNLNARAWASKSLASVSIGEPSSSRAHSTGEKR